MMRCFEVLTLSINIKGSKGVIEKLIAEKGVGIVANANDLQIAHLGEQNTLIISETSISQILRVQDQEMKFDYKLKIGEKAQSFQCHKAATAIAI